MTTDTADQADNPVHPAENTMDETSGEPSTRARRSNFWRTAAPRGVTRDEDWHTWNDHLSKNGSKRSVGTVLKCKKPPLLWGLNPEALPEDTATLVTRCYRFARKPPRSLLGDSGGLLEMLADWRDEVEDGGGASLEFALETLAVCELLPALAGRVASQFWWELLDGLWHVVTSTADSAPSLDAPPQRSLAQQMLAAELPLAMACGLPEMKPIHELRAAGLERVADGLEELLNGDGLPHGGQAGLFLPLAACWTRCRVLSKQLPKTKWPAEAQAEYELAIQQCVRLTGADSRMLVADPLAGAWTPEFVEAAMAYGGDESDVAGIAAVLPKKLLGSVEEKEEYEPPETSDRCEWSGLAVMRTHWSRSAPALALDFSSHALRLDCRVGSTPLFAGALKTEVVFDGKPVVPESDWDEVCWFSDEDVDYLELTIVLSGGMRLDRQIMLAREDHLLYFCDNLLGRSSGRFSHRLRLPFAPGVSAIPAEETREMELASAGLRARALPLALPEWRLEKRVGELTAGSDAVELHHAREGQRMACPLLIDLASRRAGKPCTWRQLTIAQSLEIQPPDVAVGYRAQFGKQQWVFYRSLAERANRTFIGQNTSSETLIARFLPASGEVDELLEVEG
ncbi:MAG: hypothetical protein AAGA92_08945 [Planctomycetota bacterium]